MKNPIINILTRTSNRPNFFRNCFESVKNQTYTNINHIISVDNDFTEEYVKNYTDNYIRVNKHSGYILYDVLVDFRRPAPYNLYLNELKNNVNDGWIMFLDDDDIIIDENIISDLSKKLKDKNQLIFWKVKFSENRIVPYDINFTQDRIPVLNDFDMNGFIYHSSWNKFDFDYYSAGDYFYVKQLETIIPKKFLIDKIYTAHQLNDDYGSLGQNIDLIK